jgi:hypothetical protein
LCFNGLPHCYFDFVTFHFYVQLQASDHITYFAYFCWEDWSMDGDCAFGRVLFSLL